MPRELMAQKRQRAAQIEDRMFDYYGEGACSLDYDDPFRLTVSVVLSAQCTDAAVNKVTPSLWERFPRGDRRDHPTFGLLSRQGHQAQGFGSDERGRVWGFRAPRHRRAPTSSRGGEKDGQLCDVRGLSRSPRHRGGYPRL